MRFEDLKLLRTLAEEHLIVLEEEAQKTEKRIAESNDMTIKKANANRLQSIRTSIEKTTQAIEAIDESEMV